METFNCVLYKVQHKFNNLGHARSFAQRADKIMAIIHGDDEMFWVTTPTEAKKIEKIGLEIVEYL